MQPCAALPLSALPQALVIKAIMGEVHVALDCANMDEQAGDNMHSSEMLACNGILCLEEDSFTVLAASQSWPVSVKLSHAM